MAALDRWDNEIIDDVWKSCAPKGRETHIDWAAVYAWAAAVGLCLAVWTGVFLLIWQGWTL